MRTASAAALGALAAPALATAAGWLTWRLAATTDWSRWTAADALAVGTGSLATLAGLRFLAGLVAASAALARGREAPAWSGRLARATAAGLLAALAGAGAAHASDDVPTAGWLPAGTEASTPAVSPTPQASPAEASPADSSSAPWTSPLGEGAPETLRAPAVGTTGAAPASSPAPAAPPAEVRTHLVVRGDSLWRITGDLLGPGATDADIALAWPSLYESNRDAIGADPDLIVVGTTLTVPPALTGDAR